ncbi:MAG: HlyD family efflux transporter periplasmic adaptor subunit [Bacteroidales bacterium]|nr:HlyD family efflux transporter periplasmic adaptor subunit [Bacteroidales bacterium]
MRNLIFIFIALAFSSCNNNQQLSDAFGNFEAVTVSVSSETAGRILQLDVEEGQTLTNGQQIGVIDTTDLYLKKLQLMAQRNAIATRMSGVQGQIDVQLQQKANLLVEKERISKLLKDKAATPKQLDDITGAIELVEKQISSIKTQNSGILEEQVVIDRQIDIVKESIRKCYIRNPIEGTVLVKYAESGEVTTPGKTLYKIANLETMELKVYVSGNQLPSVKLGQKVEVLIDKDSKSNRKLEGVVSWISQKAEFTPKIIQTKEERVDLVYGIKVRVKNDGSLKISMPGEVNFNK